jgi:hypothetical protein
LYILSYRCPSAYLRAFFVEVLILLISMKLPLLIRICYKRVREDYKMRV